MSAAVPWGHGKQQPRPNGTSLCRSRANSWPPAPPSPCPEWWHFPTSCRAQPAADAKGSQGLPLERASRLNAGQGKLYAKCRTREIVCKDASWLLFAQTAPWHQAFYSHLQTLPSSSFVFAKAWDPFSLGSSCLLEMQGAVKEYPSQDPPSLQICWHWDFWGDVVNPLIFSLEKFTCLLLGGGSLYALVRVQLGNAFEAEVLTHQNHLDDWFKHRFPGFMPVFQQVRHEAQELARAAVP